MNVKSKSKKVFSSHNKILIDPLIKRHKSQESYSDAKTLQQSKGGVDTKGSSPTIGGFSTTTNSNNNTSSFQPKSQNSKKYLKSNTTASGIGGVTNTNFKLDMGTKTILNCQEKQIKTNQNTKVNISNNGNGLSTPRAILEKKEDSVRHIETEEINQSQQGGYNFFEHNKFNANNFRSNNHTKNEEITFEDEEEENCDLGEIDEMRSSQIFTDFYTNSIGEASSSILAKGEGLINNLPKPFVKQSEKKISRDGEGSRNSPNCHSNKQMVNTNIHNDIQQRIDMYYRKLLAYSKKGDRDGFLNVLSKIYKIQTVKTNINFKDETGWTSLHYASDEGNLKIVEILIKMNVDVNIKTKNKQTPLHLSADKGYFDISKILIDNGATISTLDDEKNNPIHICAAKGHVELLKYLLEKYPQADIKNIYGKTPMELAKSERIKELLKEYLNKTTYHYHKITIHDIESKNEEKNLSNKKKSNSRFGTKLNMLKPSHNKFQSNDYSVGTQAQPTMTKMNSVNSGGMFKTKKISNIRSSNSSSGKSTTTFYSQTARKLEKDQGEKIPISARKINGETANHLIILKSDVELLNEEDDDDEETVNPFSSIEEEKIGPGSFICHALLGKGSFGEVYLVEKKNTKILYAMKVLSKDKIMGQNLVKYAMTERNVLSITDHPFIVKLSYAFQSHNKLFLILDYCPGGDLAEHLTRDKKFSEERAKIYLCEIILALEDLHKRDIIFRDLKPDNVVLDREGHALLTDFGLSKEGVLDNMGAKSFCGSIAYLAPEMLRRTGHGKSVDWYLLGVLFYEMLVGVPPYFTNNKEQLFRNIEHAELHYPKNMSENAISLLKGLLNKDPHLRLGAGNADAEEVKNHLYFKDVNWDYVYNRKLNPPIPALKNKVLEQYSRPKIFEEFGEYTDDTENENMKNNLKLNYFDGWSFVKNIPANK